MSSDNRNVEEKEGRGGLSMNSVAVILWTIYLYFILSKHGCCQKVIAKVISLYLE